MRSRLLVLAVALSLASAAGTAPSASATVVPSMTVYPVSVDVGLTFFERVEWKGIVPGCFAPAEDFTMPYTISIDSTPGKRSRVKPATATLLSSVSAVTPSFGAPGGFRQSSSGASWELEVAHPAGCAPGHPAVPGWATSPTCRKISERVVAHLQFEENGRDGRLVISRARSSGGAQGAPIGASCLRTIVDPVARQLASTITLSERTTFVTVPIRSLKAKLVALAEGSATARPSFRLPITIGGDCMAMTMSGSIGDDPGWSNVPFGPGDRNLWLGDGPGGKATCQLGGRGSVTVKRVGKVKGSPSFTVPGA